MTANRHFTRPGRARQRCRECGQPLPESPVYLPPMASRIFNAIRRSGSEGIAADDLIDGYGLDIKPKTLAAHVYQLNWRLAPFGLRIPDARRRDRRYRLVMVEAAP